jgi:hypothetical protein
VLELAAQLYQFEKCEYVGGDVGGRDESESIIHWERAERGL